MVLKQNFFQEMSIVVDLIEKKPIFFLIKPRGKKKYDFDKNFYDLLTVH